MNNPVLVFILYFRISCVIRKKKHELMSDTLKKKINNCADVICTAPCVCHYDIKRIIRLRRRH